MKDKTIKKDITNRNKQKQNNKGITLLALVITVTVMLIIAGITLTAGGDTIRQTNVENIKTNMLLIEAKTKEFVEKASHDLGVKPAEASEEMKAKASSELEGEGKGTKVQSSDSLIDRLLEIGITNEQITQGLVVKISTSDLDKMGIRNVKSDDNEGWYIVAYDIPNVEVKIYHTHGIKINKDEVKYCLDDIRDS